MSSVRRGGPRSPLLSLRKVSASVGPLRILDEVGLEVHAGQVVALMGPSGAGKSTIASLILDEPAPGVLATGEIAVPRDARGRLRVGYLPQHAGATLNPSRRIGSALGELMALHRPQHCGRGRHGRRAAALQVLAEAAFVAEEGQDVLGRYPWEFSGGQRQRLALAQVLTLAPQLLVLDEPTAGLDPLSRAGVVSQVLAQRDRGLGVLLITHDPWVAEHAAEAVISLDAGRVVARRERRCERAGVAAGRAGRAVTEPAEGPGEAEPEAAGAPVGGTGEELVCWEGVSVEFGPVRALADVDLSLRRGEAIAVMGASGSGKSTLARVLAGLQTASAGQVRLEGRALPHAAARSREQRRRVQYVWQEASASFVPHRPVLDQCADTAVNLRRISRGPAREEALAWLAQVGLTPAQAKRVPQGLSGGQLQRAALVRALLARPDVLICDEVTTAVDTELAGVVAAAIQRYRQESGAGLVLISHDVDFVSGQADRWAVLSAGRIVSVDRPHALLTAATVATDPGCQAAPSVSGQASVSGGNSR